MLCDCKFTLANSTLTLTVQPRQQCNFRTGTLRANGGEEKVNVNHHNPIFSTMTKALFHIVFAHPQMSQTDGSEPTYSNIYRCYVSGVKIRIIVVYYFLNADCSVISSDYLSAWQ